MSLPTQPPVSESRKPRPFPLALLLAVIALGAAVLAGLGLIAKHGTRAGDEDSWKK